MSPCPGVDEIDGDLRVLDPAGGAGVLALYPDGADALLHVAGLVHDQDRLLVVEMLHDVLAYIVTHRIGVPGCPAQQMLHAVWGLLPAHSAIVQQFLRGRSDSSPSTKRPARSRGSTRAKRLAIRPMAASNASRQRPVSML